MNSASFFAIDTPTLEPPQHGFTTHGNGTYSSLWPFFNVIPLGTGTPSVASIFFVRCLSIEIALLR